MTTTAERLAKRKPIPANLQAVLQAATRMSNICYNLGQQHSSVTTLTEAHKRSMRESQSEYDMAYRKWRTEHEYSS